MSLNNRRTLPDVWYKLESSYEVNVVDASCLGLLTNYITLEILLIFYGIRLSKV